MNECRKFIPTLELLQESPIGHFPPFCENLSESLLDIFLLFVKTCQNDRGTFSSFLRKLVRLTVKHFPPFCETYQNHSGTFS